MCLCRSRRSFIACLGGSALVGATGCRSAPVTGRRQLVLIPESQEVAMAEQSFAAVLAEEQPSANARWQEIVTRVGTRIAMVANKPAFQWDFRLFGSPEQNAFALPGGKVGVYDGIMPVCQSEAGLAVVMSHEIAHAIARHGSERMSHQAAVQSVGSVLGYAVRGSSQSGQNMLLNAYGAAAKYGVILPYSRQHELEADSIGLELMASAGFDPAEAPRFWQRFAAAATGPAPPTWASTHPSDAQRAAQLAMLVPAATPLYEAAPLRVGMGEIL